MGNPVNVRYPLFLRDTNKEIKKVTHAELVELRDNNLLIPGKQYQITDYVATTTNIESRSANHPFDIIVTADSKNTLNENARAIQHKGDTYFEKCNLAAWKLKYCLDNDINRFDYAQIGGELYEFISTTLGIKSYIKFITDSDNTIEGYPYKFEISIIGYDFVILSPLNEFSTTTLCYVIGYSDDPIQIPVDSLIKKYIEDGKGVIYQMIDEYDNEAQYDFKGIQFKRYKILSIANKEFDEEFYSATIKNEYKDSEMVIDENDYIWCYLFSAFLDDKIVDFSVNIINGRPRKNIFKTTKLMNGVILYKDLNIAATCGNYCGECCTNWTAGTKTYGYNNESFATQAIFRVGNECSN